MTTGKKVAGVIGLVSLATAATLFLLPEPPSPTVKLTWEYSTNEPDIVFNLYASTNLRDWKNIATLKNDVREITLPNDDPQQFFRLSASNTTTHQESIW